MPGRPLRLPAGVAGIVVGLACLGLTAPHVGPLNLACLDADGAGGVRLAWLGAEVHVRAWVLASLAVACAIAPIVLLVGLRHVRAAVATTLRRRRTLAGAASVALLAFTLVPIDESREVLLGLALGSAGVVLTAAGLVAAVPRVAAAVTGLAAAAVRRAGSAPPGVFLAVACGSFFVACALGNALVFGGVPHFVDEMDQLLHAKMFLAGRLSVPTPAPLEAFDLTHMVSGDTWYSMYPPGHTLLLSFGLLLGAPWIVNAVCGALCVALLYLVGREIYGESVGRIAAVLGAVSPFWLLVSSSFMSHTTTELCFLLFLLYFARMARKGGARNALLAGAALGYAATIRQTDVVAVALPMAVYAAWRLVARVREPLPSGPSGPSGPSWLALCALALAAFAVPVGGLLAFHHATNGDPWLTGPVLLYGTNYLPGFGNSGFGGTPHTPALGLRSTWGYLASLNQILFGWPLPSLLFAIAGLSWLRPRLWDWLLGASVAALAGVFATYWYHDLTLGPRYLYTATGPLVLLTARSLHALAGLLRSPRLAGVGSELPTASALVLVLSAAYAATVTVPWMARFYSRDYFDGNARVVRAVEARDLQNALVFVPPFLYPSFFALNDPLLDGDVVYARDLGEARNRAVTARHPGRRTYKVHSLETYEVLPYPSPEAPGDGLYALAPGRPLEIEALATQMGFFDDCLCRERKTGELGGGWKNNDHLEVQPRRIGAGIGFAIAARAEDVRSGTLTLSRGPGSGAVQIYLNDTELSELDLYAPEHDTLGVPLPELRFQPGVNVLRLEVVGKNTASASWGFAVDSLSIAPPGAPPPGDAGER
jgi:hypothetical protein